MGKATRPVIVGAVDDVEADAAVVACAAALARRLRGTLVVLHAQPLPLTFAEPQVAYAAGGVSAPTLDEAVRALARLVRRAAAGVDAEIRVRLGDPEAALLVTARAARASFVVVGSRARGLGTGRRRGLRTRLIGRSPCPVLVVPLSNARAPRPDWGREPMADTRGRGDAGPVISREEDDMTSPSILCGVDGSADADAALRVAAQLSGQLGVRLVVAHVVQIATAAPGFGPAARAIITSDVDAELAAGERLLDQVLEQAGVADAERRVVHGFAPDRLADLADEVGAELVVVGSRGRGVLKAAFLGSVSMDLIGVARRPVLVVPPGAVPAARPAEPHAAAASGGGA